PGVRGRDDLAARSASVISEVTLPELLNVLREAKSSIKKEKLVLYIMLLGLLTTDAKVHRRSRSTAVDVISNDRIDSGDSELLGCCRGWEGALASFFGRGSNCYCRGRLGSIGTDQVSGPVWGKQAPKKGRGCEAIVEEAAAFGKGNIAASSMGCRKQRKLGVDGRWPGVDGRWP
ncbi:hypothetical protein BHE74_00046343, partial [Ensete ventricosum]